MDGLALPWSDLPLELIEKHNLGRLVHERGGEREIRFLRRVRNPLIPIRRDGQLLIVPWGCRAGVLPRSGLTWLKTVEAGEWVTYSAEAVEIPACMGWHNGIWFGIQQGIRGVYAEAGGHSAAYLIVEPATYYYEIMTRTERMPVLIGQKI